VVLEIRVGNVLSSTNKRQMDLMQAYCMKYRARKEMKDAKAITMKNGKSAAQGICPHV